MVIKCYQQTYKTRGYHPVERESSMVQWSMPDPSNYPVMKIWLMILLWGGQYYHIHIYICVEVSWNRGTPKSSIYRFIFHFKPSSYSGYPHLGNPHIYIIEYTLYRSLYPFSQDLDKRHVHEYKRHQEFRHFRCSMFHAGSRKKICPPSENLLYPLVN